MDLLCQCRSFDPQLPVSLETWTLRDDLLPTHWSYFLADPGHCGRWSAAEAYGRAADVFGTPWAALVVLGGVDDVVEVLGDDEDG